MTQIPTVPPKAILFDMDGTLTAPMLDFPRIKAEMGIGERPILEALAELGGYDDRSPRRSYFAMKPTPPRTPN